jgi:thymidine phosphorylase
MLKRNESLATIHADDVHKAEAAVAEVIAACTMAAHDPGQHPLILQTTPNFY